MTEAETQELLIEARKAVKNEYAEGAGLSASELAHQLGISRTNVFKFINGSFQPKRASVVESMLNWYKNWKAAQEKQQTKQEETQDQFIQTQTSSTVYASLTYAHKFKDIALVVGGAGIGKTTTIREYQKHNRSVHLVECTPNNTTKGGVLRAITMRLGMHIPRGNVDLLESHIVKNLKNTDSLIVLDEAQFLSMSAIETVRRIHDETDIGVALVGNEKVRNQMIGTRRAQEFAQLYSRIGKQVKLNKTKKADVLAILQSYDLGEPEQELLVKIAKQPGALRQMKKVLRMATIYAKNQNVEVGHIQSAWQNLTETSI